MATKYELTISTEYVPDWGVVEAIRELYQNARDNEIKHEDNKAFSSYEEGVFRVGNKTSELTTDTLLLGCSTKRDDTDTVGKHGEGYKIAIMVLLRAGKKVKVYNYGKREIWTTKVVKSRRFNGADVPQIIVEKNAIWKKVPDHDLVIEISGITDEDYSSIVKSNLHLRDYNKLGVMPYGEVLTDTTEKGRLYVEGLYVCTNTNIVYGYNMPAKIVKLDRDRRLMQNIDVLWNTSYIWGNIKGKEDLIANMLSRNVDDVKYLRYNMIHTDGVYIDEDKLKDKLVKEFKEKHGEKAVPVSSNEELAKITKNTSHVPVMMCDTAYHMLKDEIEVEYDEDEDLTLSERFNAWLKSVENKLTTDEIDEITSIMNELL